MAVVYISVCIVLHIAAASIVNVAFDKPALMSSIKSGYTASAAVDGNTDAGGYSPNKIIDTDTGQIFAWWKVDLQREVQDASVSIYFRTRYKGRRNGVKLYTSRSPFPTSNPTSQGQLCHTVTGDPSGSDIPDVYNVTCPGRWRYLLIYTDTDNDGLGPALDYGELEVLVCSGGTYGENCTTICSSRNCVTMPTTCERDGRCPGGCKTGWTGVDCTEECDRGINYGVSCIKSCTDRHCNQPSSECDTTTGQCSDGCQVGWTGVDCANQCESGTYGSCSLSCNDRNCLVQSAECNHVTGQCEDGCRAGFKGTDCTETCNLGTYGENCFKSCSHRHCNQQSECDTRIGQCNDGCQAGWRGLDCTKQCFQGMYGLECRMACGNCNSDEVCHHVTGSCPSGCKAGWRTEKCNEVCSRDTYGPDCTEKCGMCDGFCDSVDGTCPTGCLGGYNGTKCDVSMQADASVKEPVYFGVASLVGAVVGSVIAVVLLAVGIHLSLIRQGRIQWIKTSEDQKKVRGSRDLTQMSSISPRPTETSDHVQSSNHVYNDYAVLDAGTKTDNKDYDVIKPNYYQNI